MLRLLAIIATVLNVLAGLTLGATHGAALNAVGVPGPLPFYGDLLAVFLTGSGLGFIPAIRDPQSQRFYLWVMGVGVKLVAASLFLRVWFAGVAPAVVLVGCIADGVLAALIAIALLKSSK